MKHATKTLSRKTTSKHALLATALGAVMFAGALTQPAPFAASSAWANPVRVEGQEVVGFADVVEKVSPAVVSVRVKSEVEGISYDGRRGGGANPFNIPGFEDLPEDHPFNKFFRQFGDQFGERGERQDRSDRPERKQRKRFSTGQGSGFFISEDGFLVTNHHVIDKGAEFTIVMSNGDELDAELIGSDARTDLAVLKVEDSRKFTYVKFADAESRVGEWVVAVGNPFGLGGSVTAGIISARGRDIGAGPYDDFLQIDAAVNKGNSGGPAFNLNGEVVGVNTAIFSPSGGNVGIAFAIPAATADRIVSDLQDDGEVVRGWLGVQIQPVSQDIADSLGMEIASGALVTMPQEDSPAGDAGIEAGDAIIAVDGNPVEDPKDLSKRIAGLRPNTDVNLTIFRDGEPQDVIVSLGKLPERQRFAAKQGKPDRPARPQMMKEYGLELRFSPEKDGVEIAEIKPESILAEKGLRRGDVISEVSGEKIERPTDVRKAIRSAKKEGRKAVLMRVEGQGGSRFVALPLG